MYQEKIVHLENRVGLLRNEVERLTGVEKRVKELEGGLEREKLSVQMKPEERVGEEIVRQVEGELRKQVEEMERVQGNLIEENRKLSKTLKEL